MSSLSVGCLLVPGPLVRVDPAGYFLAEVQASRSSLLVTPMYITNKILQNLQSCNLQIFTKICCNMNSMVCLTPSYLTLIPEYAHRVLSLIEVTNHYYYI